MLSTRRADVGVSARSNCLAYRWSHIGRQAFDPLCGLREGLAADVDLPNVAHIAKQFVLLEGPLGYLCRAADHQRTLWVGHLLNRRAWNPLPAMAQHGHMHAGTPRRRGGIRPAQPVWFRRRAYARK